MGKKTKGKHLPTTSKSPVTIFVWNDGASAETSHRYFPEFDGSTAVSKTLLAFDFAFCKKKNFETKNHEKIPLFIKVSS